MNSLKERIIDLLYALDMADLSPHISSERLNRIQKFGHEINTQLVCEILYSEHGLNIFSSKKLRMDLLFHNYLEFIDKIITSPNQSHYEALENFNDFNWGNNQKSKKFLKLFKLDEYPIRTKKPDSESQKDISIAKCLYSYQNWIRKKINYFFLDKTKSKVLVQMPTGAGKTRTMLEAVCDFLRQNPDPNITIVWLAHSEELCEQAASSFEEIWGKLGSESAQILRLWGGKSPKNFSEVSKPTFVVTSFQTAYSMIKTQSNQTFSYFTKIKRNCALMIVDEAHQSIAPTYKTAIELLSKQNTKIVGLTATPGRHHIGADASSTLELVKFYESNKIGIVDDDGKDLSDPITYLTEKGILSKTIDFAIDHDPEISLTDSEAKSIEMALDIPESILKKLGNDVIRTSKIVAQALKESEIHNNPTIIFAPSKESAIDIALLIRLQKGNARAIIGETPSSERSQHIKDFKGGKLGVLVNFGVLTTGFDSPNIKTVIIARPTTSVVLYSQMLGRGIRGKLMGGTEECKIIDVHDNILNMPSSKNAYQFFDKYY
jgi:DNA repair protein RadD